MATKLGGKDIMILPGGVILTMLWVPPGTFTMGSPGEEVGRGANETQHQVVLTKGYWLGQTAVTQAQWQMFMRDNPSYFRGDQLPVETVSWNDCQTYIQKLNDAVKEGGFRLPTEAEWELACRAGTTTAFSYGKTIASGQVNFDGRSPYADGPESQNRDRTVPAGSLPANPWGFCEMHGNVWEWCQDWFNSYPAGMDQDPVGAVSGECRVLRGGSWFSIGSHCRSAVRDSNEPGLRVNDIGFRLARDQKVNGTDK